MSESQGILELVQFTHLAKKYMINHLNAKRGVYQVILINSSLFHKGYKIRTGLVGTPEEQDLSAL